MFPSMKGKSGTKIRALYQRKKGRDLYDLSMALKSGILNVAIAIECYKKYMIFSNNIIPTAEEYEKNLEGKMTDSNFRGDIIPFLADDIFYDVDEAYRIVKEQLISFM